MGSSCLLHFLVCYNLYATLKINKNTEYKKIKLIMIIIHIPKNHDHCFY